MIDFPNSPTTGQQFTAGNVTWIFDGAKWGVPTTAGTSLYLPLTGGIMTGDITLKGDPTLALHPVTKQMFDKQANVSHANRIINGDMRIDQRNNGAGGTAAGYTVDRWAYGASQPSKGTWGRVALGPSVGFAYALSFTSSSAYAVVAADYFQFSQSEEGDAVTDFMWGTASAQPVTLSFWVNCSLTGTFGGCLSNYASTRSYPFTYSIPVANTWTKIIVTIPGDTAGAWVLSGNGGGVSLHFGLGAGATYSGPAGAWASTNYVSATGAVSVVGTNGATFYVTGVKLETGSVATPFNHQSLAKSLADCQRYYQTSYVGGANTPASPNGQIVYYQGGLANITNQTVTSINYPVWMRASPTVNSYSPVTGASGKVRDAQNNLDITPSIGGGSKGFNSNMTMGAAATASYFQFHYTADAEL